MAIRNSWVLGPLLCQKSCSACTNYLGSIKPFCTIRLRDCLHLTGTPLQLHLQRNASFSFLERISEWQINPEPRREPAFPLQKGNIEGPPTDFSFLEVSSYTLTTSSLPLLWAPIPWSVGNGHDTAQGFSLRCEQTWSVPASVPMAQQCWALKPMGDAACPWVCYLQGYTSKMLITPLQWLSSRVTCQQFLFQKTSWADATLFVLWSCQMLPASRMHCQRCWLWGPNLEFTSIWVFSLEMKVGAFSWWHLNTEKGRTTCRQGEQRSEAEI